MMVYIRRASEHNGTLLHFLLSFMFQDLSKFGRYLGQAAKLMVGMPDYDTYVQHMRTTHPDKPIMTYEEFFRDRQDARYSGKNGSIRCC